MRSSDSTSRSVTKRSHPFAVLANHLHAHADSLRARGALERHFFAFDRFDLFAFDAQNAAQRMARRENLAHAAASQLFRPPAQKLLDRRADQHRAAFGVEKQQSVVEPAHHLVEILAQAC